MPNPTAATTTQPTAFDESLAVRATQLKYRSIGSPYSFLNSIGIEPITEAIYKGSNIVDVARDMNVGIGLLLTWVEEEGYTQRIEDASQFSAEGYLSEASQLLRAAQTEFQLKKAKELASHGRFMASKLDKSKYGSDNSKLGSATGVTFNLHMGQGTAPISAELLPERQQRPQEIQDLEGQFAIVSHRPDTPLTLDELRRNAVDIARQAQTPTQAVEPDTIGPFEQPGIHPDIQQVPMYLRDADLVREDGGV